MRVHRVKILMVALAASLFLAPFPSQASAGVNLTFLYSLSNFHGKLPYNDVKVRVDRPRDETYVVESGNVRVFTDSGMEFFWFGDNPDYGLIFDLAIDEKGDLFLLSLDLSQAENPKYFLIQCNYRGDPKEKLVITGLPEEFSRFFPNHLFYRNDNFLFFNSGTMQIIVTDRKGVFQKGYDLAKIIEIPEKDRSNTEIFGFNMDSAGNMLFTVPVLFKAFVVSPEGVLMGFFGKPGSAPGLFGIVSGIARDDGGNYLVVERLRSVVMVFDKDFRFLSEFGYRGDKPENLIRPSEVAVGNSGKIYVTQLRNRGVSVFSLASD